MAASAFALFLNNINRDDGVEALGKAIESLGLHINYQESLSDRNFTPSLRAVLEEFQQIYCLTKPKHNHFDYFEKRVEHALKLGSDERKKIINESSKTPKRIEIQHSVFLRNPYVVVETLERANGRCERCLKEAPFIKAKDGKPYLEVHHKERLADGGEDTLDNTLALCPNCHRELHYGS